VAALGLLLVPTLASAQEVISPTIAQVFGGGTVSVIVRQADGKVIIAGAFDHVRGVPRNGLARLNADGSLDAAWNPSPDGGIAAVAIGSGGSVFVAGSFTHIGGRARGGFAKLSGSGSGAADAAWDPKPDAGVRCLTVDSGGAVYAGGYFLHIGGRARSNIARLAGSGTGAADAVWDPHADAQVIALALEGSGSIYVGGVFNHIGGQARARIAKLSAAGAGAADAAWDPNPTQIYISGVGPGTVDCLALDGSGHVYVGGRFDHIGGLQRVCIARIASGGTGAADPSWDTIANGEVVALAVDGSGNAYVGGVFSIIGGEGIPGLAKIAFDSFSYVDSIWAPLTWAPEFSVGQVTNNPINALAADASGHVYVGGNFTSIGGQTKTGFALLSSSGAGAADPAWSSVMSAGGVLALARDGAGRSVIGGRFQYMGDGVTVRNNIARLNADNTLDTAWHPESNGEVDALAIDPATGAVYAAGQFTGVGGLARNHVAKLSGSGTGAADAAWNPNADGEVVALALDSAGGSLYAGGTFASIGGRSRNSIARLSTAGSGGADATWNPNATPPATALHTVRALALDGAGHLFAGGYFTAIGGLARSNIARLSTSGIGAADAAWNPNADAGVNVLTLDGSGAVYVGGAFQNIGGQARAGIARLSVSGSGTADAAWNPGSGQQVNALVLDGHGGLYAGGGFTLYHGVVYASGGFSVIGGGVRYDLAKLSTSGTGAADCNWIADCGGGVSGVVALALDAGGNLYVGGGFSTVGGATSLGYAVLGPATRTSGCGLAITGVNGGLSPGVGSGFSVAVQARDSLGRAQNVATGSGVTLSRHAGTGVLGGTLTCQIAAGASSCTAPAATYSKAEPGVVLRATSSGGDLLAPGDSAPFTVIATPPPSRLAFSGINGGSAPPAAVPFSVTIQARDVTGTPRMVTVSTAVGLVLNTGTGVLGGANSCQIAAAANSCTIAGVTYSKAESGVVLTAFASYGAATLAGNSLPFAVNEPAGARSLTVLNPFDGHVTSSPPGLDCAAGNCSAPFPTGAAVTLTYAAGSTMGLDSWGGACSGSSPSCQLTLTTDSTVVVSATTVTSTVSATSTQAIESSMSVGGTETQRVDQPRTRVIGRFGGAAVYDQTFNAPFADAAVQAAVTAAGDAVRAAAGSVAIRVGVPVQTASSDTALSSVIENRDAVEVTASVVTTSYIGPQTIPIGWLGVCAHAPTSCPGPFATLVIKPGSVDFDTVVVTRIQTNRTVVTTETHRVDTAYEIAGVRRGHLRRVLPAKP